MDIPLHSEFHKNTPALQSVSASRTLVTRRKRQGLLVVVTLFFLGGSGAAALLLREGQGSQIQAKYLSHYAEKLSYTVEAGPSDAIYFPSEGPFDKRLGYARLPRFIDRLEARGMAVGEQARFSPALTSYANFGLFPPYAEKTQAGLGLLDCRGQPMYQFNYPQQGYANFRAVPPVVTQTLLFIENRGLLDAEKPQLNPAVSWGRFTKAAFFQFAKFVGLEPPAMGGSTLATQIEKFRHSPEGLTLSSQDKLRQMASASIRAYRDGPDTEANRRALVLSYLNTVPLSAAPGHGEVHGLADGLRVWFNADFMDTNDLLRAAPGEGETLAQQGLALRRVMALMIAQRRPSYYLVAGQDELNSLTDSYLRLLAGAGEISNSLRDAALAQPLGFRNFHAVPAYSRVAANKGTGIVRSHLRGLLGLSLYDLDRLDLSASATLQADLQWAVTDYLQRLQDPEFARAAGLVGDRLLAPDQAGDLHYSFTLFERTADGNRVRVQTDSTDQPFDINEGSKLELGSTAKLRVLATYLEIIAELHSRYAGDPSEAHSQDALTRWVVGYLSSGKDPALPAILRAAIERRYSASPHEPFFTGGGLHRFSNFRRQDNGRNPTVREALRESLNLPFVRMMKDIVSYTIHQRLVDADRLLEDDTDPRRLDYLGRFADREGNVFLQRFWHKYQGKVSAQRLDTFLGGLKPTPVRLAAAHRYLFPAAEKDEFAAFLRERLAQSALPESRLAQLYDQYGPDKYSLSDQAYIIGVHPLELWVLRYQGENPGSRLSDARVASTEERQEVYGWLLRTRAKNARDTRIRTMLEVEAFTDIHQRWRRLGYPFSQLVPSLGTALGSSGDRPAALAELMGIIVNDGVRQPTVHLDSLEFAADTPYETHLARVPGYAPQVMAADVAAVLREMLAEVVDDGTGRRLQGTFTVGDGSALVAGGKTGTGDNRIMTVAANGQSSPGRALNRTATFVFYLGPRHFGTLTAFVPGKDAANFRFTSALPVQVLKGMSSILQPYLQPGSEMACADGQDQGILSIVLPQASLTMPLKP